MSRSILQPPAGDGVRVRHLFIVCVLVNGWPFRFLRAHVEFVQIKHRAVTPPPEVTAPVPACAAFEGAFSGRLRVRVSFYMGDIPLRLSFAKIGRTSDGLT